MKCDEIFAALAMLEKERGIPQNFMMGKIIQALTTAYKRDHEGVENVIVDVDEDKHDLRMYVQKEIVEEVMDPANEISLEDAKKRSAKNELGGVVNIPVENVEFGRIAAGNGKQVIIQGLREAEHGMIYDEFNSKQHEILTGTVVRIDPRNGNVILKIGTGSESTEAVLSQNEQVVGETLTEGQMVKVYLVEVRRTTRGPQVLISRTHPGSGEAPFRAGGARNLRRQRGDPLHRPRGGQPHQDGRVVGGREHRSHRRLRRPSRPARQRHRGGTAGREDRYHQVQRGSGRVHRRGTGTRRCAGGASGFGGQGLPRHRA